MRLAGLFAESKYQLSHGLSSSRDCLQQEVFYQQTMEIYLFTLADQFPSMTTANSAASVEYLMVWSPGGWSWWWVGLNGIA